MKMIENDAN